MSTSTIPRIFNVLARRCSDGSDRTQMRNMVSFKEWLSKSINLKKKKNKEKFDEPRGNQTNGKIGHFHQQGQATGGDSQVAQQTVHLFPMPDL
jgi:hypothetical protein